MKTKKQAFHSAAFILQKTSEVLSILKAPFKRKTSAPTTPSTTPNLTPTSGRNSVPAKSTRTSMVNCMNDSELCDLSSLFDSNIYAEIETNDRDSTEIINDKSSMKLCRKAILAAFDDFDEKTKDYAECVLSKSSSEDEMMNNIEKILNKNDCQKENKIEGESADGNIGASQPRSHAMFSMISSSIKNKLKSSSKPVIDSSSTEKPPQTINAESIAGNSLATRLKDKLKIGIKLGMLKHISSVSKIKNLIVSQA